MDYGWPEGDWLRATMVAGLDGAHRGPDGRSRTLSGPADLAALVEIRRLCDAVIIGAETFRVERYKPFRAKPEWQEARAAAGLAPAPRLVIVTRRLELPWDEAAFTDSFASPIVATVTGHSADLLERARAHAEVWELPGVDRVDLPRLVERLHAHGLRRLVTEGGPLLLDEMVAAGLVDEIALTVSPAYGLERYAPQQAEVRDGFVFTRWTR